jgi:hypothetical protein
MVAPASSWGSGSDASRISFGTAFMASVCAWIKLRLLLKVLALNYFSQLQLVDKCDQHGQSDSYFDRVALEE